MEFQYRACDERCPSTGAAATSANSETAATRVHEGLVGGDGAGCHGENSPPPPAPSDLRRRAVKEMIRARILREAAEQMALEAEVWRELMEERASSLARLSETRAAPALPSPKTAPIGHEAGSMPEKRKSPAASAVSVAAATSSKKQKPDLTCTVCNITATSALALQEHLRGKSHGKKACKPAPPLPGAARPEVDLFCSKVNGSVDLLAKGGNPGVGVTSSAFALTSYDNSDMRKTAMLAHPLPKEDGLTNMVCSKPNASAAVLPGKRKNSDVDAAASTLLAEPSSKNQKQDLTCRASEAEAEVEGGYTPTKLKMLTNSGMMCEMVQLNGSILCEVCDVRTADLVTMMCHLEGSKHASKQAKQQAQACEPPAAVAAGGDGSGSGMVAMEADGVRRLDGGFLLCALCNVKVPSECTMQSHLSGRKHTNKQKATVGAALGDGSGSETVSMEANGVRRLDGGFLLCELCDVKVPSECVMQTHLSGKKHTNKQKAKADAVAGQEVKKADAAAAISSSSKEAASIIVNGSDDSVMKPAAGEMEAVVPSATRQVDGGSPALVSVAPMEIDEHADANAEREKADAEHRCTADGAGAGQEVKNADAAATIGGSSMEAASTVVNGSDFSVEEPAAGEMEVMELDGQAEAGDGTAGAGEQEIADAEEEEAIKMEGVAAVTGEEVKIQVDGMPFIVLRQADGSLFCGLCGEHGCDKDDIVEHLYTSGHWRKAHLAEEKKQASKAAEEKKQASKAAPEAMTNADGDGVLVTDRAVPEAMSNAGADGVLVTDGAAPEGMSNAGGDGVLVTDGAAPEGMSNAGGDGVLVTDGAAPEGMSNAGGDGVLVTDGAAPEGMSNARGDGVLVTDGAAPEAMSNAGGDGVLVTHGAAPEAMSNAGGDGVLVTDGAAPEAMSNASGDGVLVTDGAAQVNDN